MRELRTLVSWVTVYLVYKWSFPLFLYTLVCLAVPAWTSSWITATGSIAKAAGSPRRSSASRHPQIWALMGTASTGPCRGDLPLSWATPHLQASRPPRAQPGSASSKSRPCDFQRHSEKEKVMKEWKKCTSPRPVPAVSRKRAVLQTTGHFREDRWPGSIAGVAVGGAENQQRPCHVCTVDMDRFAAFLIVSNSSNLLQYCEEDIV